MGVYSTIIIGYSGPTGSMGNTGYTGYTGMLGNTGQTGMLGNTGSIGYVGMLGNTGSIGIDGLIGHIGPIGYVGTDGPIGHQGNTGPTGSIGYVGMDGPIGHQGNTGPTGSIGMDGPVGITGYLGQTGTNIEIHCYTLSSTSTQYISSSYYGNSYTNIYNSDASVFNVVSGSAGMDINIIPSGVYRIEYAMSGTLSYTNMVDTSYYTGIQSQIQYDTHTASSSWNYTYTTSSGSSIDITATGSYTAGLSSNATISAVLRGYQFGNETMSSMTWTPRSDRPNYLHITLLKSIIL